MSNDIKQYTSVYDASHNTKDEYIGIHSQNWYDDNDRIIKNPYYKKESKYSNDSENDIKEDKVDRSKINSWMDLIPNKRVFQAKKTYDSKINIPNMSYKLKVNGNETEMLENALNENGFEKSYINEKYVLISTYDNQKLYVDSDKETFKNNNSMILIDFDVFYYLCNTKMSNDIDINVDCYQKSNKKSKDKIVLDKLNNLTYEIPKEWYIAYEKNCKLYFVDSKMKRIKNINIKDYQLY